MKKYIPVVLLLPLMILLVACSSKKEATISSCSRFTNTMTSDESNSESGEIVPSIYTVKVGDEVEDGYYRITRITDSYIRIKFPDEYTSGFGESPKKSFKIKKGESCSFRQYGLMDADFVVYVSYIE